MHSASSAVAALSLCQGIWGDWQKPSTGTALPAHCLSRPRQMYPSRPSAFRSQTKPSRSFWERKATVGLNIKSSMFLHLHCPCAVLSVGNCATLCDCAPRICTYHKVSSMKLIVSKFGHMGSTAKQCWKMSKTNPAGKRKESLACRICCCKWLSSHLLTRFQAVVQLGARPH